MRSLPRLPRAAAGAVLALAVLALHVLLLGGLPAREAADAALPHALADAALPHALPHALAAPPLPVTARLLRPPPQPVAPTPSPAVPLLAPAGKGPPRREATPLRPTLRPTPLSAASTAAANAPARTTPLPSEVTAEASTASTAATASAAADADADADAVPLPLPRYATRLPPSASLHYRTQRGDARGSARLQWQHDAAGGYGLRLDTAWPGQPPAGSSSRGQIDADGVAPQRHAEIRRAREVRAANFQRDAARITFSGPQLAYALPPGAQDRLSWMVQLAAIVDADAGLRRAGARITLFVVGARGDADAWHFEVLGAGPLALPAGAVADALHLKREAARPYDTRVEVWLDPARQHLPVRALFTTLPGAVPLSMELTSAAADDLEIGAAAPR